MPGKRAQMKKKHLFIIYFICLILQLTVVRHLAVWGTAPDLILVLTIVFSFFYEDFYGVFFGVLFSILRDICVAPAAGISGVMLFLIGLALQFARFAVYRDNKLILFVVCTLCTAVYYAGCWGLSVLLLQYPVSFLAAAVKIPAAIVWNYVLLLVVCHFARKTRGFTV